MGRPQSAICREAGKFGLFITLGVNEAGAVRTVLAGLPELTTAVAGQQAEPSLVSAVAIGAAAWPSLVGKAKPSGLVRFPELVDGPRRAPSTPADLFLHIHSDRHDANFALAAKVVAQLSGAAAVIEEIHGFKTLGGRDLTGFVDGTENPVGDERPAVALVTGEPAAFAGGSFVSIQRYVHDLRLWESRAVAEQEMVVGRTKADDLELSDEIKPPTAHIARVVIEEDGEELAILRHSMPYGTTGESGLYFVAYGASPAPFAKMLNRMVKRDADGNYDHLLDFTRAVTGASFFAPSEEFLRALA